MLNARKRFRKIIRYLKSPLFIGEFILLYISLFANLVSPVHALDVTLQWFPNSEPTLAGYRVYYREEGQNYDFVNPDWEGSNSFCTLFGLDDNTIYYFVTRAFDIYGNESENSNEVCNDQTATTTDSCVGDFDNDADVDGSDLAQLQANFFTDCATLTPGTECVGDINNDGYVDFGDLALMEQVLFRTDCF